MNRISIVIHLLICFILITGCKTEIDISNYSKPIPVVYFLFDPGNIYNKELKLKLTKSFVGHQNAYQMAKIKDSVYFKNAFVYIESRQDDYLLDRLEFEPREINNKEPGVFINNPNIVFTSRVNYGSVFGQGNNFRLIIEIPEINTTAYSEFSKSYFEKRNPNSPQYTKVEFYKEYPFTLEWTTNNYYSEIRIGFHYREYKFGMEENKYVEWTPIRTFPEEGSNPSETDGLTYKEYLFPADFYEKIANIIKDDTDVTTRIFNSIDFMFYCSDKNLYEYIQSRNLATLDQSGHSFTNIVNGIGICASLNKMKYKNYKLGTRDLDSLANGQYTKHLKFKRY